MSEFERALADLAQTIGGLRAAVVLETSGIELTSWGEGDFEVLTAEVAELWKAAAGAEALGIATPECLTVQTRAGACQVLPLGGDYLLALFAGPEVPPGKARFLASEWAHAHREAFA